jgi:hypothetical protein
MRRIAAIAAALVLTGAGCTLDQKIGFRLPFTLREPDHAAAEALAEGIGLRAGMKIELRPTVLGLTGTIDDVLGRQEGLRKIEVTEADASRATLRWSEPARPEASGSLCLNGLESAKAMALPALWASGTATSPTSGLWLSRAAYRDLVGSGSATWRIGLADAALGAASAATQAFEAFVGKEAGAGFDPFRLELTSATATFPVRLDGKVASPAVVTADGWFAEYVILKDPDAPLVLKVNVHPIALGALQAFQALDVDPKGVGYEIVSIDSRK